MDYMKPVGFEKEFSKPTNEEFQLEEAEEPTYIEDEEDMDKQLKEIEKPKKKGFFSKFKKKGKKK